MKFLSYSPSLSSSSSITSYDARMCNARSATAGCIEGILRRILCSGNIPTHPSDLLKEADFVVCDKNQELKTKENIETPATPGIVARLMGLESMPEFNLVHARPNPNSIKRSRSMNSADHLAGVDPLQGQHRGVKSSLSFREKPTFLELENENFLILSFENEGESKELTSRRRNSETGVGELKQRREERSKRMDSRVDQASEKNKKKKNKNDKGCEEAKKKVSTDLNKQKKPSRRQSDKPAEKISNDGKLKGLATTRSPSKNSHEETGIALDAAKTSKPVSPKEVFNGRKRSNREKKSLCVLQKIESECSSEDSSPVSVLDFGHFLSDTEVPHSEHGSSLADSKSRRKLSPELENYKQQSPRKDGNLIGEDAKTKKIEGKYNGAKKRDCHCKNYMDVWGEIVRLTGADLVGSNWVCKGTWKHEDFERIGGNIEVEILDQLLDELVGQLSGLP